MKHTCIDHQVLAEGVKALQQLRVTTVKSGTQPLGCLLIAAATDYCHHATSLPEYQTLSSALTVSVLHKHKGKKILFKGSTNKRCC